MHLLIIESEFIAKIFLANSIRAALCTFEAVKFHLNYFSPFLFGASLYKGFDILNFSKIIFGSNFQHIEFCGDKYKLWKLFHKFYELIWHILEPFLKLEKGCFEG